MNIDLSGKIALVTGAGSGIGEGCAVALADAGVSVWVNDLDGEKAQIVADRIGGRPLPGDIAVPGPWLEPVLAEGALHILVHNAGYDLSTPMGETDPLEVDRLLRVQVSGPLEMTQLLLPSLKQANGAVVIHIASVHGNSTNAGMSAYSASKGAQISMVRALAQDLGEFRTRALTVSPGFIHTALFDNWVDSTPDPEASKQYAIGLHPMGRIGLPADVGALVTFLASPFAEFINATNVVVDGGLSARLF